MKSIHIEKFGGPEVLKIQDIEIRKPGPKEVLIKKYRKKRNKSRKKMKKNKR